MTMTGAKKKRWDGIAPRLWLVLCAALLLMPGQAATQGRSDLAQVFRAGISPDNAPYEYAGAGGRAKGFTPQLLREIGNLAAVSFEFITDEESDLINELDRGAVDVISLVKTRSVTNKYSVSDPHSRILQTIFRHKAADGIISLETLKGHKIGLLRGGIAYDNLRGRRDIEKKIVESRREGMQMLQRREIDALFCSHQAGVALINRLGFNNIEVAVSGLYPQDFCFVAKRSNSELISLLNEHLRQMQMSGAYSALVQRELAQQIHGNWLKEHWYIGLILLVPLALLLVSVLWNQSLGRAVRSRTAALRESERRYRQLIEVAPDGMVEVDVKGRIIECSRVEAGILGYSHTELIGKSFLDLMDQDSANSFQNHLLALKAGNPIESVVKLRHRDGEYIDVWRKGVPLMSGKTTYTGAIFYDRDIRERQRIETELKNERDFTAAILDTASALVLVVDTAGRVILFNKTCEKTSGFYSREIEGRRFWEMLIPEQNREAVQARFEALLAGSGPVQDEVTWVTRTRARRLISWSYTVLQDQFGKPSFIIGTGIDITDRKKAEQALTASEEKHRQIVNATSSGFWLVNRDQETVDVNESFCRMLGRSRSDIIGMSPFDFLDEPSRHVLREQNALIASTRHRSYELVIVRKDGTEIPVAVEASTLLDEMGQVAFSFAFLTDITERKQHEEQLRKSEALHRKMFEGNEAAHLLVDPRSGVIVDANAAAVEFYGYPKDEMLNLSFADISTRSQQAVLDDLAGSVEERRNLFFEEHRLFDDSIVDVEIHSSRLEYSGRRLVYLTIFDITKRKRAAEQLRASEERLSAIFNNAAIGISLVDLNRQYIQVNQKWAEMIGYSPEETLTFKSTDITYPDDLELSDRYFESLLNGEVESYRIEKRYFRKDASVFWGDVTVSPIRDKDGKIEAILGVIVNISEIKRSAQERERLIEELQEAISQIKTLHGLLPICAYCKKIRDDKGYWKQIESYLKEHSDAEFTHSVCPSCAEEMYPDLKLPKSS